MSQYNSRKEDFAEQQTVILKIAGADVALLTFILPKKNFLLKLSPFYKRKVILTKKQGGQG